MYISSKREGETLGTIAYGRLRAIVLCLAMLLSSVSLVVFGPASPASADASAPAWWNGSACDVAHHKGSYALGASYNGVQACGPGAYNQGGTDVLVHFYQGAYGVYEWECVELVMRYMYLVYGIAPYAANGNTVVGNYSGTVLTSVANDGNNLPSAGDIISFAGVTANPNGHTAVITAVNVANGSGTVTIMEQNATSDGWGSLKVAGNKITTTVLGGAATGWLHNGSTTSGGGSPPPPQLPSGASPIQNGGFNADTSHWGVTGTANLARYTASSGMGTNPYEGNGFAATNASQSGDSITETNVATISPGDTWCASAEFVTVGNATGGSGQLALWLTGGSSNANSTVVFSGLPGTNGWREYKTCVTATVAESYVKVQIYPSVGAPTIGVDAVDVHQTLNANGGFDGGNSYWNIQPGTNFTTYTAADNTGTNPYQGSRFGATNTATSGGSIYQDLPRGIGAGDTFCAEARVVTVGNTTGGAGALYVYLTGTNATEESHYSFSGLPGNNGWTPAKTCVTAMAAHSNIRVQLYPAVNVPTIGVAVVDVHSSIIQNGGLNGDSSHWGANGALSYMNWSNYNGTLPYEGSGFESIQASSSTDSLVESRGWQFGVGDTFCASAQVITPGQGSGGGSGVLAIWLLGPNGSENSTYSFSGLPAQNSWTPIKACVMATIAETSGTIQVQFYPTPGGAPVGVDAVDVH